MKTGDRVVVVGSDLTDFQGVIVRELNSSDVPAFIVDLENPICDMNLRGCWFSKDELELIK